MDLSRDASRNATRRGSETDFIRLQKKADDLEFQVELKESQARETNRKLKSLEESERSLKAQLESFTKQAKETYRKYDNFLEDAEEVAHFSCLVARGLGEVLDQTLESIASQRKLSFKEALGAMVPAEGREKSNFHLKRLLGSQYLNKKKLFTDATKFDLSKVVSPSELQPRLNRIVEELGSKKDNSEALTQISSSASNLLEVPSERAQKAPSFAQLTEENKEEFLDFHLKAFARTSGSLVEALALPHAYATFSAEKQTQFIAKTKAQLEAFWGYLTRMLELNSESVELKNFNSEVERQVGMAKQLEGVDLQKLQDLREQNRRLLVLKNHVMNLSHENDELHRSVNIKEFSLLEQNQLIIALERNVNRKQKGLVEKQQQLLKVQKKSDQLQDEATFVLRNIIEIDQKIVAASAADEDTAVALKDLRQNFERKKKELESFEENTQRTSSMIQETMQDIEMLDLPNFGAEPVWRAESPRIVEAKMEPPQEIRRRVRDQINSLLAQGKPPLGIF